MNIEHHLPRHSFGSGRLSKLLVAALLPLAFFSDAAAQAQLFVHPTLVMLSGAHRNDVVHVVNQGNATGVFVLEWRDFAMTPEGGLSARDGDASWSLQPFARFSPRRVTLRPGETQLVRIALRPSRDAAEGEYYSHLRVVTMQDDLDAATSASEEADKAITIKARTAIAVPVLWRNSDATPQAMIESADFDPERNRLVVGLRRSGKLSTRGYLHVVAGEGATSGAFADPVPVVIYPSIERRKVVVPLNAKYAGMSAAMNVIYTTDLEMERTSPRFATYMIKH